MLIKYHTMGAYTYRLRRVIFEGLPLITIGLIMALLFNLSSSILPPTPMLIIISVINLAIAIIFRWQLIRFHSWLQIKLFTVMEEKPQKNHF
jgi:lipopolysaccharide export LptBFGC system permease protein LptF